MSVRLGLGALLFAFSLLACSREPTAVKAPSDIQPSTAASSAPVLEPTSANDASPPPGRDRRTTRSESESESESENENNVDLRRRIRQGAMADSLL